MRTGCVKFGILAQCHVGADKQAEKLADRVADHGLFSGSRIDITRYAFGSEPDSQSDSEHDSGSGSGNSSDHDSDSVRASQEGRDDGGETDAEIKELLIKHMI